MATFQKPLDAAGNLKGVFTDGDLRRLIGSKGDAVMNMKLSDLEYGKPKSVDAGALLNVANDIFKSTQVDTLLVLENGKPIGMLDIQDLAK